MVAAGSRLPAGTRYASAEYLLVWRFTYGKVWASLWRARGESTGEGTRMMPDAALLRETERRRLRSLVEVDLATARPLHAECYELITPNGYALSKREYLGDIESGQLRYEVFEPVSEIVIRGSGQVALLRYRARITIRAGGAAVSMICWHTDYYEQREGCWQAVWSQATAVSPQAAQDQPFSE